MIQKIAPIDKLRVPRGNKLTSRLALKITGKEHQIESSEVPGQASKNNLRGPSHTARDLFFNKIFGVWMELAQLFEPLPDLGGLKFQISQLFPLPLDDLGRGFLGKARIG